MARVVKESTLQRNIQKYIESKDGYVIKVWGGGFQEAGIPDLIACVNGVFIGMEVKVGYNKPSLIQIDHVLDVCDAYGLGCVVWSLDEAKEIIDVAVEGDPVELGELNRKLTEEAMKMYEEFTG